MITGGQILSQFFEEAIMQKAEEAVDRYRVTAKALKPKTVSQISLTDFIAAHQLADRLVISVTVGGEPFSFVCPSTGNASFFNEWERFRLQANDEDEAEVVLIIDKEPQNENTIMVYDHEAFFEFLEGLTVVELITVFSKLYRKSDAAVFVNPHFVGGGHSNSIFFIEKGGDRKNITLPDFNHFKKWDAIRPISHFGGLAECLSLPEDFDIIHPGCLPAALQKKMQVAAMVLLLSIIYDFATVQNDTLFLKLNGYKTFNAELSVAQINTDSLPVYNQVYQWVTTGGNVNDKIGLARNLISLSIDPLDKYSLDSSVYTSILSGFKVYEKQNVKQYIELRNKMSDQLISFNEKAGNIVDSFAVGFQKSALAVVTLYASIIVTRVLSSHDKIMDVFTPDATILSFTFLGCSLAYFFVNLWEIKAQKRRFEESYLNMKTRNEDLLTAGDIKKILNNDIEHQSDVDFINDKQKWYTYLWIGFIVLFSISTLTLNLLYSSHHPQPPSTTNPIHVPAAPPPNAKHHP